jgi:hypothetical protein
MTEDTTLPAIDEALAAGEPTADDPMLRELQELGLLLRDDSAEPDPAFGARLGGRVRAGFPRRRRMPRLRRPPMPVLAGAAAAVLAVAVAVPLLGSDENENDASAPLSVAPREMTQSDEAAGAAPTAGRRIERSTSLTIAAPGNKLDDVADGVTAVTERHRGFVLRSSVTSGEEGPTGGSFDLRIPAAELQTALRELGELGDVRSRTQSGADVTPQYVSVRDRLDAARAERKSLLRRLERADTDTQAETIRQRLDAVAVEIRNLRGQLKDLRLRTNYARVGVTLVSDRSDSGGSGFGDAFDDFTGSLAGSAELALRALGVLLPLSLLALVGWLALRLGLKRRRESGLV